MIAYLDAGEKLTTDVEATPGLFYAGDVLHHTMLTLAVAPKDVLPETPLMAVNFCLPEMQVASPETHPYDIVLATKHGEAKYSFTHFAQVSAGHSQ